MEDAGDIESKFGNDDALLEMVHRLCNRKGWLGDACTSC